LKKHCVEHKKNAIYFCRYEDLEQNPKEELTNIMKYLLNLETLDDTYIKKRIEEVCKANVNKPKTELNVHKDKYTKEQLTKI
jgi:hypothetical protein